MTTEHIIITEEVQKDGTLQTIERETLQTTVPTPDEIKGQQAYGVTHPDYIAAADRVYYYNEETGMSESELKPDFEPMTIDELRAYARRHDVNLHGATTHDDIVTELNNSVSPAEVVPPRPVVEEESVAEEGDEEDEAEEDVEDEDTEEEPEVETESSICAHPIGNGTCYMQAGHSGSHRLYAE